MENTYSISDVATKLGLSTKTLRRWEETGKFVGNRTLGNQRRYTVTDIHILDAIKHGIIDSSQDLLTLDQAASLCGVSPSTFARWEDEGKIHPLITAGMIFYPKKRILQKLQELRPSPTSVPEFASVPIDTPRTNTNPFPTINSVATEPRPVPPQPIVMTQPLPSFKDKLHRLIDRLPPSLPHFITNIITTVILILGYHLVFRSVPATVPSQGSVQGVQTERDASLVLLDKIMSPQGVLTVASLTTPTLSFTPSSRPDKAAPGSLYFDAGSSSLKIYRQTGWSDLNSPTTAVGSTVVTSGRSQLTKGESQLIIKESAAIPEAIVAVTFEDDYSPAKKYWVTTGNGSFTLHLDYPVAGPTSFTYIIMSPNTQVDSPSPSPSAILQGGSTVLESITR